MPTRSALPLGPSINGPSGDTRCSVEGKGRSNRGILSWYRALIGVVSWVDLLAFFKIHPTPRKLLSLILFGYVVLTESDSR